ncbi:MAG TPA: AAA family ATPase [Sedimentisphaerales bacterium]|nr:AAA family ATPase [Sedimentisphaerales bacterium]
MEVNPRSEIIERAELLSPETMPEKITGRARQVEKLQSCLKPMEKGCAPISSWLYGPPGTGKTVIARKVAEQACSSPCRVSLYVNCWQRPTFHSVVQALCEQLQILGAEAKDANIKLARLRQFLKDKAMLVILDEIDRPMPKERESIIYQLLQLPKTGLYCISSDTAAFFDLEMRVRSKLSPARLHFSKYSVKETEDILTGRALGALVPNTYTDSILQKVALLAGGDARVALYILLKSAIAAENGQACRISTRHIPADVSAWQRLEKTSKIQKLPQHQQLIYKLAKKHGQLSATKLRRIYRINCYNESIEPVARRTFTKNIAQLAQLNLISIEPRVIGGPGRLVKAMV